MSQKVGFMECEPCRNKPGSPQLCVSCLNNRALIETLEKAVEKRRPVAAPRQTRRLAPKDLDAMIAHVDNARAAGGRAFTVYEDRLEANLRRLVVEVRYLRRKKKAKG